MNIALFASAFYPHVGGVEEVVRQLAHAYRNAGHTVVVFTNRWPRNLPAHEDYEGIPVHRLLMRTPEGGLKGLKAQVSYRMTHQAITRDMLSILRRYSIEVLHVQCISSNGYYAMLAKQALRLPLVITTQGELTMDADHIYQRPTFMNHLLPTLLENADTVTACSKKTMGDLEQHIGHTLGSKGQLIYNGAHLSDYERTEPFQHPKPYILGIARMVPQKGLDILLRAFARAELDSHDLILAGDGPERPALEALAHELGISKTVHFLGSAPRPLAMELLKGCSFFVLPSRADEGLPLVGLEAMAAGKAIIATPTGGVLEIMADGENVLVVPKEDVSALATAIRRLSTDHALCQSLGKVGKERSTAFDWPAIAGKYIDLYGALMQAQKVSSTSKKVTHSN